MRNGLTLLANYTWSKAIDNRPTTNRRHRSQPTILTFYPIYDTNFKRLDHGPSDFDHRNVVSISYVYAVPKVMKDAPGVIRFLSMTGRRPGSFNPVAAIL